MLTIPIWSSSIANIVSIDPGSSTTGIAVFEIDVVSLEIMKSFAWTIDVSKLVSKNSWDESIYDNRFCRLNLLKDYLYNVFCQYKPIMVGSESPFINSRFPAAGIALTETLCKIKEAIFDYDRWLSLKLISPSSTKNAVGAAGNADKFAMTNKVAGLAPIIKLAMNPYELDEHSIDALAVGYATYLTHITKNGV